MKARKWILAFLSASGFAAVIFGLRRGWERPLLGFADALSVGGFFCLVLSVFPFLARSDAFDGFSYAAKSALAGFFPALTTAYSEHKKQRAEGRAKVRVSRESAIVGGGFLAVGLVLSLFFL